MPLFFSVPLFLPAPISRAPILQTNELVFLLSHASNRSFGYALISKGSGGGGNTILTPPADADFQWFCDNYSQTTSAQQHTVDVLLDYVGETTDSCGAAMSALIYTPGLYLSESGITDIQPFSGLSYVFELYLDGNEITSIPADSFAGMTGMAILDLSDNKIASIDPGGLVAPIYLMQLQLSGNLLTALPNNGLGLAHLQVLDLGHNRIGQIGSNDLAGLGSLKILNYHANRVASIASSSFSHLGALETLNFLNNLITIDPSDHTHYGIHGGITVHQ